MRNRLFSWNTAIVTAIGVFALSVAGSRPIGNLLAQAGDPEAELAPTHSSPVAITAGDTQVWSVNPDNDSVSVFNVASEPVQKIAEIGVGKEPWCVAIADGADKAYVTNMASGTVSVISMTSRIVIKVIEVGVEPFGCALTPDGAQLFVTNQSSGTVSVIDTESDRRIATIRNVGAKPHGIAITADGKKAYVTQFLALHRDGDTRPLTQSEGADDGREGLVTVIDAENHVVLRTVRLTPLADVGAAFKSDGNTLAREPLSSPPVF